MASFNEFRVEGVEEPIAVYFFWSLQYRLADDTRLPVEQEAAWCDSCRSFGPAEFVPSIEELHQRIEDRKTPSDKVRFIYGTDKAIREAKEELMIRLIWRQSRHSPARCLNCGSTNIIPVRFDDDGIADVQGRRVTFVTLGFADTADRIADFTPEGILLR